MTQPMIRRSVLVLLAVLLLGGAVAPSASALPIPSKTAPDQTLAQRDADLAGVRAVLDQPEVAGVLASHGLSADEVNLRLAQLSPEEIGSLASQVDQLQAAGQWAPYWIWILVGVLIVVAIVAIA